MLGLCLWKPTAETPFGSSILTTRLCYRLFCELMGPIKPKMRAGMPQYVCDVEQKSVLVYDKISYLREIFSPTCSLAGDDPYASASPYLNLLTTPLEHSAASGNPLLSRHDIS